MSPINPFGDDNESKTSPFGDDDAPKGDPLPIIEEAARRVRMLRGRMGSDGLTPSASRELVDHLAKALEATARALRDR